MTADVEVDGLVERSAASDGPARSGPVAGGTGRPIRSRLRTLFGHTAYRRFIVLSRSRTGSTLLTSYLNSHPDVRARGEVLKVLDGRSVDQAIRAEFGRQPRRIKARGFKVFYYHPLDAPNVGLLDRLAEMPELYVVHLRRQNILRTLISREIAGRQDTWTRTDASPVATGGEADDSKRVSFTAADLTRRFEQTRAWELEGERVFRQHPVLDMSFETLIADAEGEFRRATAFLGVPYVVPTTPLKRQNPEPIRELLTNYDDLEEAFRGTEWATFFDDESPDATGSPGDQPAVVMSRGA